MKRVRIFCFVDALGWEISKRYRFLEAELPHRSPLGTIFGYSSTCDPTILTGRKPRDHGHFAFYFYDPVNSPFRPLHRAAWLPKGFLTRGRVRNVLSRWVKRAYGYTGYFQLYAMPFEHIQLFDYSEKRDIYQPGGINDGGTTIFDDLRSGEVPFYLSDWRAGEERNLATLRNALEAGDIEFAYLYLASMDAILHADGNESIRVRDKMAWYEGQLREVLAVARQRYDDVELYVFSDHGMTDITEVCDLMSTINQLGLIFGTDYAAAYDSTMARFWFLNHKAETQIRGALAHERRGTIVGDEQLTEWGVDFPDRRYGELFFLLNPGVLLCPSHMGIKPLAGMHGYDPEDRDSVAFFGTTVDLEGRGIPVPQSLLDLRRLMSRGVVDG